MSLHYFEVSGYMWSWLLISLQTGYPRLLSASLSKLQKIVWRNVIVYFYIKDTFMFRDQVCWLIKRELQKPWCIKSFLNLLFKRNLGGLFRGLFCSGCVWGGWNYFCFHFLKDKQLLLLKMFVLQTMCPRYGFKITPNRPKIRNMAMLNNNLTIWHHRQSFLKLLCFSCHD